LLGIGHLYAERYRRGVFLLIGGWAIIIVASLCMLFFGMSHMVIPPPGYPEQEPAAIVVVFLIISIVLFHGFSALWIWQIIDARSACKKYNRQLS